MKLPDKFWIRMLNGKDQRTWLGSPAEEKGYVLLKPPTNPDKVLGKVRIRVPAGEKVVKKRNQHGVGYYLQVLVGKNRLRGDLWWTVLKDTRVDADPVEIVSARMNKTVGGETVVEVKLSHSYEDTQVYALRPHVAQRLLGMIHTSLHPDEERL